MSLIERSPQLDVPRGELWPKEHTAYAGTPCFDEDLGVPQSRAHRIMVYETGAILDMVAEEAGLQFLSDHPIWYLDPDIDRQRAYYGDWAIAERVVPERITARDLRVVVEVVSTAERKKEVKDTLFQAALNAYNQVPEFGLVFPETDDPRALRWCVLDGRTYRTDDVPPNGQVEVRGVPGLVFRVRPRSAWRDGRKLDVVFRGELRRPLEGERARAEEEKARAEEEKARAEEEKARAEEERARAERLEAQAEEEKARAERLEAKLRALGVEFE